ncbi:MAG: hypothetical protein JNM88_04170 [Chitinophagaceae bacterium]|nr:hypothetical protein [Chitinophagaceae bacterium]
MKSMNGFPVRWDLDELNSPVPPLFPNENNSYGFVRTLQGGTGIQEHKTPLGGKSVFNNPPYVPIQNFKALFEDIKPGNMFLFRPEVYSAMPLHISNPPYNAGDLDAWAKSQYPIPIDKYAMKKPEIIGNPYYPLMQSPELKPENLKYTGYLDSSKTVAVKINQNHIRFCFQLTPSRRVVRFIDAFLYATDVMKETPSTEYAFWIETNQFESYLKLTQQEGLQLSENQLEDVRRKFVMEVNNAMGKPATMAWLYRWMPGYVFESLDKQTLIESLETILHDEVVRENADKVNVEKIVLYILSGLVTDNPEDQNKLLEQITTRKIGDETLFEILYDELGKNNWVEMITLLFKIWSASKYTNPNLQEWDYKGKTDVLPYHSEKILGFYSSGFSFSFKNNEIEVKKDIVEEYGERRLHKKVHYTTYKFLQPIQLQAVDENGKLIKQEGKMQIPNKIPAFYLKAFDDKNSWANLNKATWLAVDIAVNAVLISTGIAELRALKYAVELAKDVRYARIAINSIMVLGSTLDIVLKFADCKQGSFCEKLQEYLFWINIAVGGLDAITQRMLRNAAKDALTELENLERGGKILSKDEKLVKEHLEQMAGMAEKIKTTRNVDKFLASAKKLENITPEEALEYLDEALVHFNHEVVEIAGEKMVVQISETNCINVVQKVEEFLKTGKISKASHCTPTDVFELDKIYPGFFKTFENVSTLKNVMKEGERAIIYGDKGIDEVGHVFNVIKTNGKLKFVDGQLGKAADLNAGYISFKYLKTVKK